MIQPGDIHTLTDFKQNSSDLIEKLEASGRPQVLTVEGRPKFVVLAVDAFEKLAALADRAEAIEGMREGIADMEAGRHVSLREFDRSMRERFGLPPRR